MISELGGTLVPLVLLLIGALFMLELLRTMLRGLLPQQLLGLIRWIDKQAKRVQSKLMKTAQRWGWPEKLVLHCLIVVLVLIRFPFMLLK